MTTETPVTMAGAVVCTLPVAYSARSRC